ncbi:DnaT-like ssDNA-binding domain-containing protein [Alteromonas sp. C1M14]|uniref:DnaT-like ssDNA-binding domain-containing protein n=1 Tax=Alteromonas sp. C1M14 TaxID=2841567 RepID=UPI0020916106|nr:DnaT-like ssDNA-binding domain-containing protein [Alteromonas sp. C1M14]
MFTEAEYNALTRPLTNESRVLYTIGLRPGTDINSQLSEPLNYKFLIQLLNGANKSEDAFTRGQQINHLLGELSQAGLVTLNDDLSLSSSLSGKRLLLPLCRVEDNTFTHLHRTYTAIDGRWRPDPTLFEEMANLIGLIDREFSDEDIGEFVAYWLSRPDAVFSHFQWTQKFANTLKRKRVTGSHTTSKRVGSQSVPVAPGIEADDNAKKLVEKYASNKKG